MTHSRIDPSPQVPVTFGPAARPSEPCPPSAARPGHLGARNRHGFTLTELVVVVTVVSILAAIAMPNLRSAIMKARAAEAVGDLRVLRQAVFDYLGDNHQWPPDAGVGEVPEGLAGYLPENWSMTKEDYQLNYDNWTGGVGGADFIAVTVEVADTDFGGYILDMLGPNAWTNGSFKFTWVLEWLS